MRILLVGEGASELGGALETLVRRLGLSEAEIDSDRVSKRQIHAHHGKGKGYFKRAVRWMREAAKREYDAIILVIDEDGRSERLREFAEAQLYAGVSIRRAFGVAIRTFDAWMLSDEKALSQVLLLTISRQPDPESIADPKRICNELLNSSSASMTAVGMYAALAELIAIQLLEARCERGFAPFAQRIREL
jgi:hypothetical protein